MRGPPCRHSPERGGDGGRVTNPRGEGRGFTSFPGVGSGGGAAGVDEGLRAGPSPEVPALTSHTFPRPRESPQWSPAPSFRAGVCSASGEPRPCLGTEDAGRTWPPRSPPPPPARSALVEGGYLLNLCTHSAILGQRPPRDLSQEARKFLVTWGFMLLRTSSAAF